MLYLIIKTIHIISSTILFGTGLGTAFTMFMAHRTKNVFIIATTARYVVFADWLFTATSAVVQPLSGLLLVYLAGYSLQAFWVWGSIAGYVIAALCWLPVVYLQLKIRNMTKKAHRHHTALPVKYYRYFNIWFILGWPAFISLLIVFYLMTAKPYSITALFFS